jgi:phosphoglucan,water dikinase
VTSRTLAGIPHEKIHMAVLIQQMLVPDLSFIMHTVNPLNNNRDEVFMELAVGLGETLASGSTPGIPFRMVWNRPIGRLSRISYSSFSTAAWPGMEGGVIRKTVDHSGIELSRNRDFGAALGARLGKIGVLVEDAFGKPQDIEGLVAGDDIYLVQSRPQQ